MSWGDVAFDADLVANVLGDLVGAPALYPGDVELRGSAKRSCRHDRSPAPHRHACRAASAVARRHRAPQPGSPSRVSAGRPDRRGSTKSSAGSDSSPINCSNAASTKALSRWKTTSANGSPPGTPTQDRSRGQRPPKLPPRMYLTHFRRGAPVRPASDRRGGRPGWAGSLRLAVG